MSAILWSTAVRKLINYSNGVMIEQFFVSRHTISSMFAHSSWVDWQPSSFQAS